MIGIVFEIVLEKSYDKVPKQITHVLALKKIVHSDLLASPTKARIPCLDSL
jgi:hypothetical protein